MRRAIISIIIVLSLLCVTSTGVSAPLSTSSSSSMNHSSTNTILISDIENTGSNVPIDQYVNRLFSNQDLTISNSFSFLDTHENSIDLSSYQIPGWTLYKVIIDTDNVTAISEREVVGSSATPSATLSFAIDEPGGPSSDEYINQLAQGFYNMSHDGQLQNISLLYWTPSYDPPNHDYAYFDIRSDYQNGSTNMVSSVQLEYVGLTPTWANVTESVILDADNVYYALMNGTELIDYGGTNYPEIYWFYENDPGEFLTSRYSTEFGSWGTNSFEAILNYTYIPWNKTSSSPLVYTNPSTINIAINSSYVSGDSWIVSSVNNITALEITTNQSVDIFYNLTLCYTNDNIGSTVWGADSPSTSIAWNVTTSLFYPVVSNIVAQSMNITNIPTDWNATGLYIGGSPGGSFVETGTVVICDGLSDGSWTLTSVAPNYAVDLALFDSSDDSSLSYKVENIITIDVNATIEDGVGTLMNGGTANLSVLQAGVLIHSPIEIPASVGALGFQWDISATTSGNGTHSVEVYWISTDGLESGYITQEVFVYHSATLVADESVVNAYAENATAFSIGIDFDTDFPVTGLDGSYATVEYSFDGGVNTSLIDQTGGRWTATVSTVGKANGSYLLYVFAEGYALENQSLTITVNLIYETLSLNWSWSNTNNITYTDSTNLSISYLEIDGINRIPGATVNVTIEGVPHNMKWDLLTETYWIELTGVNFTGTGTFVLDVLAWIPGYESQNTAINITIRSETTGMAFNVDYNPTSLNFSYIDSLFIQVTYDFNSVPIDSNTLVRVTFNGSPSVDLDYNATSLKWEVTLKGSFYFGFAWDIMVRATADGYSTQQNTTTFTVYEDTPIVSNSWVASAASTDYATPVPFSITLLMSNGTPINDATVSFTAFSTVYSSSVGVLGVYKFNIDPNETRGVESFTVTVVGTGYVTSQMNLNLTVDATTSLTLVHNIAEWEEWDITIEAQYMDSFYSTPILGASVNITFDGTLYILQYVNGVYAVNITLNNAPSIYTIDAFASAQYASDATDQSDLEVLAKRYFHILIEFTPPQVIAGELMEVVATLYSNVTGLTVPGFEIHFEISIYFANGTALHYTDSGQTDTTNSEGVATFSFDVPEGQIERLSATASYVGSREFWSTYTTETTGVTAGILSLVMSFLMSDIGLMMILSIAILGIVAAGYNRGVKPKKKAAKAGLENQLQMFKDLETVQHFMAVYLDRGTCVFYHPFTDERIQPDLISGFIAAITSVYGEIKGDGVRGTLEEIQYHGLRLNSYSGQYIIGILILEGEMTTLLRERLQFFVELFENQYDQDLDGWTGLVDCFDPEWVVSTLNSAFNYAWLLPHRFGPTQKVAKLDAKILDYIGAVRDERSEFYIKNLLSPLAETLDKTEPEVLDRLLLLQDRGVIAPIGIQTILQRQGLALVNGSDVSAAVQPTPADEPTSGELEFEELAEEEGDEPKEAVVQETEPDSMESFVQDVESLLVAKADDEKEGDDELDEFAKELRAKIGEDEDSED